MSFDYINEAFKRLDALNEDMFDTSLTGLNNLSNFMDEDDASDIVKVIDPTAETEDAVSDSYIGKVIINCNVCHSHIFEIKEDVVIDEDGVVNPEMQCPYCGEMSGFTVIGEIMPFEQTAEETPDQDPAAEIPAEDAVDEAPAEDAVVEDVDKKLDEGFNFDTVMSDIETLKGFLRSKGHACKSKEAITYLWSVIDLFEAGDQELSLENIAQWYEDTCRNFPEDLELFESVYNKSSEVVNVSEDYDYSGLTIPSPYDKYMVFDDSGYMADEESGEYGPGQVIKEYDASILAFVVPKPEYEDILDGSYFLVRSPDGLSVVEILGTREGTRMYDVDLASYGLEESFKVVTHNRLSEDVNNVNVETDDSIVNVHTEESGKVVVTTEPKTDTVPSEDGEMTISPVSDETIQEIETNNDPSFAEPLDHVDSEDSDEIDFDIEEVDEDSLDELGESYLKRIYENVESFKTCGVSTTESKMIVEGTITFKSGTKKKTGFVFEAYSASRQGKVKFVGKNEHFSSNNRAFALTGTVKGKKLLPESLVYNYGVGAKRIRGSVKRK